MKEVLIAILLVALIVLSPIWLKFILTYKIILGITLVPLLAFSYVIILDWIFGYKI